MTALTGCAPYVLINPRGYSTRTPAQRAHFTPFDSASLSNGLHAGESMQEITADDIRRAASRFSQVAVMYQPKGCNLTPYPLTYWQSVEDTLRATGGRLIVVTERYDAYDTLQASLRDTSITYHIYVMSGAAYGENNDRASKLFLRGLYGRKTPRKEKWRHLSGVIVLRKEKIFTVPAPAFIGKP